LIDKPATQAKKPVVDLKTLKGCVTELSPKCRDKLVKLVGEQCCMTCMLDESDVEVLWDTGAQVSMVTAEWLKTHAFQKEIRHVSELINSEPSVRSACGDEVPFEGWVDLSFSLKGGTESLSVSFLVSASSGLERPIAGYNVINHYKCEVAKSPGLFDREFQNALPHVPPTKLQTLLSVLNKDQSEGYGTVEVGKQNVRIPSGSRVLVKYVVHAGVVALFVPNLQGHIDEGVELSETLMTVRAGSSCSVHVPVQNNTKHAITVYRGTSLGTLQPVHLAQEGMSR
jgi:hypothetical protein